MTPVMARCACSDAYPLAECAKCTPTPREGLNPDHGQPIRPPAPRPPADDHGLTIDHSDTQTATDLAALAGAITGAVIGGSVLLGIGLLERLLRKRP